MRKTIAPNIDLIRTIAPANITDSTNGAAVDLAGFDSAVVIADVGAVTDGSISLEVQHADDDGTGSPDADTWAAVDDEFLDGDDEPANLTANTITKIGYLGVKRHLRVVATDGGTGDATFGVSVLLANGRISPVA